MYPSSAPCPSRDHCPGLSFATMASDIRVTCPNNDLALKAAGKRSNAIYPSLWRVSALNMAWLRPTAALDSPVYRYLATHKPSGPVNATSDLLPFASRFSFHSLDVVSFFRGLEVVLGKPLSDADGKFQSLITQHLVTFATTGELTSCLKWGRGFISTGRLVQDHSLFLLRRFRNVSDRVGRRPGV